MLKSENYKLSVIVTFYNLEDYIEKNIKSIIDQSIDMEIIYVDDGSTDKSIEIVNKYKLLDNRIKIFQKDNGGPSSARNYGLKHSTGEYIIFIDGDDYIERDSLKKLYNAAKNENLDILQGCYRKVNVCGEELFEKYEKGLVNAGPAMPGKDWMLKKHNIPMVWSYMFRRDFLMQNNLTLLEGVYHEDVEFIPRVMYFSNSTKAVDIVFYNYVQRQGSIMKSKNINKFFDLIKVCDSLEAFQNKNEMSEELNNYFKEHISYLYAQGIHNAILTNIGINELLEDKYVRCKVINKISSSRFPKYKIMASFLKIKAYKLYEIAYSSKTKLKKG